MVVKLSNKNRVMTLPKIILENRYPLVDLKGAEKTLAQGLPDEEIIFSSNKDLIRELRKRKT